MADAALLLATGVIVFAVAVPLALNKVPPNRPVLAAVASSVSFRRALGAGLQSR